VSERFYVTTPIYYPNDVPHIGHAYTTVAADVSARYHRMKGEDVFFLTGTDEHGQKILEAAQARGLDAKSYVDGMIPAWRDLWTRLDVSNDDFIRTTEDRHITRVQAFWQRLHDNGDVYLGSYEGPYCVACEDFYKEEDLLDGTCPIHHRPVDIVQEENYFFRLSKYQDWLLNDYYARDPAPVQPGARLNEVVAFARGGLQDISISRTSFSWGVPLPWDPKHVLYVWVDALLNYITALGYPDGDLLSKFWPGVNMVGKDILRFHAVTWPAMLHAAGIEPPQRVVAHGWLLVGGEKMSKTKLTGIHPDQLLETFGVDAYRYYFLRDIAFGQDGNFSWESMVARYNAELANGIGNLASRVLAMIDANFEGAVPDAGPEEGPDAALREVAERSAVEFVEAMDRFGFNDALDAVDRLVRQANGYLVATAPWKLVKEPDGRARAGAVLYRAAETLRVLAVLLAPFMPRACDRLWVSLGNAKPLASQRLPEAAQWGGLQSGSEIARGESLFPRIEV